MATLWYFAENGARRGPVPTPELMAMVRAGRLAPQDRVWNESLANWTPLGQVPELAALLPGGAAEAGPQPPLAAPAAAAAAPFGAPPWGSPPSRLTYAAPGEPVVASARAVEMLRQTKPWVRFVGVMLFVGSAFLVVGAFMALAVNPRFLGAASLLALASYGVLAGIGVAAGVYLNRYASRIGDLLSRRRGEDLEAALEVQRTFWRLVGTAALAVLLLYALFVLSTIVTGFVWRW